MHASTSSSPSVSSIQDASSDTLSTVSSPSSFPNTGESSRAVNSRSIAHRPAFHHAATDTTKGAKLSLGSVAGADAGAGAGAGAGASASSGRTVDMGHGTVAESYWSEDTAQPPLYRHHSDRRWDSGSMRSSTSYTSKLDNPYVSHPLSYPAEKYAHSPPPRYSPPNHAVNYPSGYPSSNASSRTGQTQLLPPADITSGGFFSCAKRKLMGKEGGMGMALMLGWVITTVGFLVATAFWRGELFGALDRLSKHLRSLGVAGKGIFLLLILLTTIPPLPLYSTLMVLAGYTFGVWEGFVVSYLASLLGAVLVFVVSRCWLRDVISKSLQSSPTAQSLLAILPANPHLLLLIRIAPYPYNLLNVILASAPSLSLKTYTACTAISLLKLILHTWIGAGIHDIASFGAHPHHHGHGHGHGHWMGHEYGHGYGSGPYPGAEYTGNHGEWPDIDLSKAYAGDVDADPSSADDSESRGAGEGAGWGPGSWGHPMRHGHTGHHGHPFQPHGHVHGHGYGHHHRMRVKMYATWLGIALCVGLFFYLTHVAKRALRKAQAEEEARRDREGGVRLVGSDEEC